MLLLPVLRITTCSTCRSRENESASGLSGEYDVDTVNGGAITIKRAFAPRIFNAGIPVNGLTVSMGETMPADSHFKFASRASDKYDQLAQGGLDNSSPLFGEMNSDNISQLFRTVVGASKKSACDC